MVLTLILGKTHEFELHFLKVALITEQRASMFISSLEITELN